MPAKAPEFEDGDVIQDDSRKETAADASASSREVAGDSDKRGICDQSNRTAVQ